MVNRILLGLGAALVAVSTWGCAGADCRDNADCDADEICQAGGCATRCTGDDDCPVNRVCAAGVCQLLPRCSTTTDCAGGQVCNAGQCQPQQPECAGDVDCPPNFSCFEGGCYAPGTRPDGGCGNCANGETCVDGECIPMSVDIVDADTSDVEPPDVTDVDAEIPDTADAETEITDTAEPEDIEPDVAEPEDTAEVEDIAEPEDITELADIAEPDAPECGGRADCDDGEICVGGSCVPDPADVSDAADVTDTDTDDAPDAIECVGAGTRTLGQPCAAAGDCCSNTCAPRSGTSTAGICTEECRTWDDCDQPGLPEELFCYRGSGLSICMVSGYGDVCSSNLDCNGNLAGTECVRLFGRPTGICSFDCLEGLGCPEGSACGHIDPDNDGVFSDVCVPVGATCSEGAQCPSGLCLTDDAGSGFCTAFCNPFDATACARVGTCDTTIPGVPAGFGVCL